MSDIKFKVTNDNVKVEMTKVWEMANKGLKSGEAVVVTLGRESASALQSKCYHAMIGDIAAQVIRELNSYTTDIWKALLVSQFATERHQQGNPLRKGNKWVPSLCNTHMVCIRPSVKEFNKSDASDFIEFLFSKGSEFGVEFSDSTIVDYDKFKVANG